ncbi:MAG: GHKL domain-containing protein [Leptospiraceae bacterium]|nr:GHKL domain-containing protein [Leptospiraceae bacterium]
MKSFFKFPLIRKSTLFILFGLSVLEFLLLYFIQLIFQLSSGYLESAIEALIIFSFSTIGIFFIVAKSRGGKIRAKRILDSKEENLEYVKYLSALDSLKNELLSINIPATICYTLSEFIIHTYKVTKSRIFLWEEDKGAFIPYPSDQDTDYKFYVYDPFILWITDHDGIYSKNNFSSIESKENQSALDFFDRVGAKVIVPLTLNNSLIGMLILGDKTDSSDLSQKDWERLYEIKSVSVMALSNAIFYERLTALTENLETKVKERTRELEEAQSQLIMSEKMASLGVMVAGIAHEINTPSGVINGSADNLDANMSYIVSHLSDLDLIATNRKLRRKFELVLLKLLREEKNIPIDSKEKFKMKKSLKEKYRGMGLEDNLASDLATFLIDRNFNDKEDYMARVVKEGGKEIFELLKNMSGVYRNLKNIKFAIKNIVRIVKALKYYSHLDQASFADADLTEGIENTLIILNSQMKHGVDIERQYSDIPRVPCNLDELNQVWTNLITNAVQAMKGKGKLILRCFSENGFACVEIEDSGPGIPLDIREKIWDPFFTTKDQGEGSGLGLGIVKGIIDKHKGKISVSSIPGRTTFKILIPMKSAS